MRGTDGQALTIGALTDLMDRLDGACVIGKWDALRIAVGWAAGLGAFGGAPVLSFRPDTGAAVPGDTGPGTPAAPSSTAAEGMLPPADAMPARDGACGPDRETDEIPAGPQGAADPGGEKALTGAAVTTARHQGPEAGDPPPAPPVAGGGAPSRNGLPWTEEEEARAVTLRLAGLTVPQIAAALGRTKGATVMQFSKRIAAMVAVAREAIITEDDAAAPDPGEPPAALEAAVPEPTAPEPAMPEPVAAPAPSPRQALAAVPAAAPVEWRAAMTEREIAAHLDALPPDAFWDAGRDFRLAHALWTGEAASGAAELLGCTREAAIARWRLLCPVVSLDNQRHLNALLKARLPLAAGAPVMEAVG